jgi:antirestriction protein ArdC
MRMSQTNFVQTARIELAMPTALSNKLSTSVSPSSDSHDATFKTLTIIGTASFTCSK